MISRVRGDPNNPVNRGALCGKCAIAYNDSLYGVLKPWAERIEKSLAEPGS